MKIDCVYSDSPPLHQHEYPDDWIFGGADDLDPRSDPRFKPTTYEYFDDRAQSIHVTQVPLCDDQAIDEFTKVANSGPKMNPVWLAVKRPGGKSEMLPWIYVKATDTVYPTRQEGSLSNE